MIDEDVAVWRALTEDARLSVGAAFAQWADAGRQGALAGLGRPDLYVAPFQAAGHALRLALDVLAAAGEPPNVTLAVMLGAAAKHLGHAATLAESADDHLDDERLATEFATGCYLWRRMQDEMLVLTGDAPLGSD